MILITWPDNLHGEHRMLNLLFEAGLITLHVRKPGASIKSLRLFLKGIEREYHNRIMLHQAFELLHEFSCRGVHFAEPTKRNYEKYLITNVVRSWPVHALEEIDSVPDGIDYIMLSPVFSSISKSGYHNAWSPGELQRYLKENKNQRFKYIALGGIDSTTAPKALKMGFDGFAVLGAIWVPFINKEGDTSIVARFKELQSVSETKT